MKRAKVFCLTVWGKDCNLKKKYGNECGEENGKERNSRADEESCCNKVSGGFFQEQSKIPRAFFQGDRFFSGIYQRQSAGRNCFRRFSAERYLQEEG
jgi:hypothetical protein